MDAPTKRVAAPPPHVSSQRLITPVLTISILLGVLLWIGTPPGSSCRREDPVKGQYSEEFRLRHASVPAAFRAGNILVSEKLDGVEFREIYPVALPLQINGMAALWAYEDDLVGLAHTSRIARPARTLRPACARAAWGARARFENLHMDWTWGWKYETLWLRLLLL